MNDGLHLGDTISVSGFAKRCSMGTVNKEPLEGNPYVTFRCSKEKHFHTVTRERVTKVKAAA